MKDANNNQTKERKNNMDEIRISLERIQELAKEPGLAFVWKNGRWLYSWHHIDNVKSKP